MFFSVDWSPDTLKTMQSRLQSQHAATAVRNRWANKPRPDHSKGVGAMTATRTLFTLFCILCGTFAYTCAYIGMVQPVILPAYEDSSLGVATTSTGALYQFGGNVSAYIFLPANWVDRRLRPQIWVTKREDIEELILESE